MRPVPSIAILAALGLVAFLFAKAEAQNEPAPVSPELSIEVTESQIRVSGHVSSFAHEAILRQTLLNRFADLETEVQLIVAPALPPGWALVTELALDAMAETKSGKAKIGPQRIDVRAITSDDSRWTKAAALLADNLLPEMQFTPKVAEIRRSGPLERQCLELFRTAMRGRRIDFSVSSAELRSSVSPVLDELIQVATDCPNGLIRITGHTDASGHETGNLALSQARAEAVASYFIAAGIPPERLVAEGAGSSDPIVRGDDARARRLNRRIEIDIRFP